VLRRSTAELMELVGDMTRILARHAVGDNSISCGFNQRLYLLKSRIKLIIDMQASRRIENHQIDKILLCILDRALQICGAWRIEIEMLTAIESRAL